MNSSNINFILEPVKVVIQGHFSESVICLFYASVMCRWRVKLFFKDAYNWLMGGIYQPRSSVCVPVCAHTSVWRKRSDRQWRQRAGGISRRPFLLFLTFALLILQGWKNRLECFWFVLRMGKYIHSESAYVQAIDLNTCLCLTPQCTVQSTHLLSFLYYNWLILFHMKSFNT